MDDKTGGKFLAVLQALLRYTTLRGGIRIVVDRFLASTLVTIATPLRNVRTPEILAPSREQVLLHYDLDGKPRILFRAHRHGSNKQGIKTTPQTFFPRRSRHNVE